ncbi:MAG: PSD1 and planctomycete cytochrome C domain-containing protein [Planctomyces sp.]
MRCGILLLFILSILSVSSPEVTGGEANSIVSVVNPAGVADQVASEKADPNGEEVVQFFETHIRPLFADHCVACHGPEKQSGGLRLDTAEFFRRGGDSGAAVTPGIPDTSRMIQAVRHEGDLQMPPEKKISDAEVRALTEWVALGAPWPDSSAAIASTSVDAASSHWAFQPITDPPVPESTEGSDELNPIDAFIRDRLQREGLKSSPEADRRTLIRRVTYTLTGLPPTPDEVDAFVNDSQPLAFERLVDRLLDSKAYGEHWARHWLDVARYSDTKGYVYAREERFWVHAWAYRDWIVRALNEDMPYDRFLKLQIAADQIPDRRESDLAAMGFLTVGRRFLGVQRDIVDDRIDVVTRGTMSLTVGCARCHDHKYDPVPTADYYSLYGVFQSSRERLVDLASASSNTIASTGAPEDQAFFDELKSRENKLRDKMSASRAETAARVRSRIRDYLQAQKEISKYPEEGFDQILSVNDVLPAFVRRWQTFLRDTELRNDPVFVPWHHYVSLPAESFAAQAAEATRSWQENRQIAVNPRVADAFRTSPESFAEVVERYGQLFDRAEQQWRELQQNVAAGSRPPEQLPDVADEQLRQVLYGREAPCEVPDEPIVHTESDFDSGTCTELWKLQAEVDRWIIQSPKNVPYALILEDREVPRNARILRRGNPSMKGDEVPRQFLKMLSGSDRRPFEKGSGRLELAEAIASAKNPLTARVIVNRVWAHHFGAGLVTTPGDFGIRAVPPSHPELLDWLASRLIEDNWSLKSLHRRILLSATYRQSSEGDLSKPEQKLAIAADPANRLLWRMNAHRLSFEELRDSMLSVCGTLDSSSGGKPQEIFQKPFPKRRTLYGLVDRQFLPGTLRVFDFANPDLHIPQRSETMVPQQSLFLMNHPLALEQARNLAEAALKHSGSQNADSARGAADADYAEAVGTLFRQVFQRQPSDAEIKASLETLRLLQKENPSGEGDAGSQVAAAWSYGYGIFDEAASRTASFQALPHFTGTSWQGGATHPDNTLGWVQLTATGGHPGNDRQHAAIRRWTAPAAMRISLTSSLVHEPAAGDGIRAFIVSSRSGVLASTKIHQKTIELNVPSIDVLPGETIDFVVDIDEVLNSDQYLWKSRLRSVGTDAETIWDSERDFPKDPSQQLTPFQQLAQVLLCSNEFLFVD